MNEDLEEANDSNTSWSRLWTLFKLREGEVLRALLDHPNLCPTDDQGHLDTRLLLEMAKELPEEVALHPAFVLHALIEPNDEMEDVAGVIAKRTTNVGLIEALLAAWVDSWMIAHSVASNPSTPEYVIRHLYNESKDPSDWDVREAVASNPSTPEDLLRLLGNPKTEAESLVRLAIASNPKAPNNLLENMCDSGTESEIKVSLAAQKALASRRIA